MPVGEIKLRTIKVSGSYQSFSKGEDVKITDENGNIIYAEGLDITMGVHGEFNKAVLREIVGIEFCGEIENTTNKKRNPR